MELGFSGCIKISGKTWRSWILKDEWYEFVKTEREKCVIVLWFVITCHVNISWLKSTIIIFCSQFCGRGVWSRHRRDILCLCENEETAGMTLMAGNDRDSYLRPMCLRPQFFLKWHLLGMECPNGSFICTSDPWVEMTRNLGLAGIALSLCI